MKNKTVVFTAISGNYDSLRDPVHVHPEFDYVCFTDDDYFQSDVWDIVPFDQILDDPRLTIRYVKLLPHRLFPEYDISIWVDGNTVIQKDLGPLLEKALSETHVAMFRHPEARVSVYDEVQACLAMKKDSKKKLLFQRDLYYSLGFSDQEETIPAGYVIFRRHNQRSVILVMEEWWMHVLAYSRRDQISFPFVAWKQKLPFTQMDHKLFLEYFTQHPHTAEDSSGIISFLSQGGLFQVENKDGQLSITRHPDKPEPKS
jgi:hypothetical protein